MQIIKINKKSIIIASQILAGGGIVICPTDTVYGFLALAENKKSVEKIFKIKKRPKNKTLPIFVKDLKMAKEIAEMDKGKEKILKNKWPGKYTFILNSKLKNKNLKLSKLVIKDGTMALRIPNYKFLNDLLKKINKPLAQTSVNISENPPMNKIRDIIRGFGNNKNIDLIIDVGDLNKAKPSKIFDLTSDKLTKIR